MKLSKLVRIAFEERDLDAIADVIVPSGTAVYAQDGTVLVPEEAVEMLKKKRVPFTEVEGGNGSLSKRLS